MIRSRKASRSGQLRPLRVVSPSISSRRSGGKAPGKLAVARAASTSSIVLASPLPSCAGVRERKAIGIRCSLSCTTAGECSLRSDRWPWKSVAVTNRSSGWPAGSRGGSSGAASIAAKAFSSRSENPAPLNGGSNQRPRMRRDTLVRTSSRVSGATLSLTAFPGRSSTQLAIGCAQNLANRHKGRASLSVSLSISAFSSQRSVRGSSDWPECTAWARKIALIPPALAPLRISGRTRSFSPASSRICSIRRR